MISPAQLAVAFARNVRLLHLQAEGLTQADSLIQPQPSGNCLNWVLGHLALCRDEILDELEQPRVLSPEAAARYDQGGEPLRPDDPGALPLDELLTALKTSQERMESVLNSATEEDMARPAKFSPRERPLSDYIFFMYFHECYHTGQTELLRQLAGKAEPVIR